MRPIDADELKKPVGSYNPVKWTSEYGFVISVEDIDHAPTIAPVKHGQWEWIGGYGYQYRCSECIMCAERTTNYCPNCGAYMKGARR